MLDKNILKSGDIILFHTKGFSIISWGIRGLTRSYWNHTGVYGENHHKKGYIIEALGRGVVETPIDKYIGNKKYDLKVVRVRREAYKDEEEYDKGLAQVLRCMENAVGKKYDWWAIVFLGIKYSIRSFWNRGAKHIPQKYNPFQSRYKFFCSELVCRAFYQTSSIICNMFAGKKQPLATCSTITPKDINKSINVDYIWGKCVT